MSVTLTGEIERVTFESEQTGFRVLKLLVTEGELRGRHLSVVGVLPAVGPGTRARVTGELRTNVRHGEELRAESLVPLDPQTLLGIERFLGSGVVPGLGPGFAKRIVKSFGLETLPVLDHAPHRLAEVKGLGAERRERIAEGWKQHRLVAGALIAVEQAGASPALAARIVRQFGTQALSVVQREPYRLCEEVVGIGFKTADEIARKQGLPLDHPDRVQAGLLFQLRSFADSGHTAAEVEELRLRTEELLGVDALAIRAALDVLLLRADVIRDAELVQLERLHRAEVSVASDVRRLLGAPALEFPGLAELLTTFEQERGIQLAPSQRAAVELAVLGKFAVITGGPGVGKTTIVRAILAVLEKKRLRIALAAPTGRAAQRLAEATKREARTIHRLLEIDPRSGSFTRDRKTPLEADLLIVDESSMIDVPLAASLLAAVPDACRVVFVGDIDQLPSVGPGAFLADLIGSGAVSVARLDVVFRQAEESGIIQNSHRILHGEMPLGSERPDGDFFLVRTQDPKRAAELVLELVTKRIPERFGLDPKKDIQVLTPMHRGEAGTLALNAALKEALNPGADSESLGEAGFRRADKVLVKKNDYERGVFNGDVGEVVGVDVSEGELTVRFEDERGAREVVYKSGELGALSLAYALSIHKSQGSEYPAVVLPLLTAHFVMLSRNLVYTAVTRAKRLCVLVADPRALSIALGETRRETRRTTLGERLRAR